MRASAIRATTAVLAIAVLLGLPGAGVSVSAAVDTAAPPYHPSRLTGVANAGQVVVVTTSRWSSSHARLRAYERTPAGDWTKVVGPVPARIGRNGFVPGERRVQGSATTPAGTYGLRWAFGTSPDPGTALRYRHVGAGTWWPYDPRDPATYNVFQPRRAAAADWRPSWAEELSTFGRQYRHAVVVGFNLPTGIHRQSGERVASRRADTRRGGGIFLHVHRLTGDERLPAPTTGCVSIAEPELRRLLRWLDPSARPTIVMGPRGALG